MIRRFTIPDKDALNTQQIKVINKIIDGPRGKVPSPIYKWLVKPELADRAQLLGESIRYESSLRPELIEIIILLVARYWDSKYEWEFHKEIALDLGIPKSIIKSIKESQVPEFRSNQEECIYAFTKSILEKKIIEDDLYESAKNYFGEEGLVDMTALVGYYSFISMTINVFEIPVLEKKYSRLESD
ncbi:MAG: carboxymuconolactone decarboxylase family protein [Pseudomonadota bacterium]|nr:4-carboxymuconolactone decarboxylase [Gammaproteobacteria bacterium]MEE2683654.1 carboxymuconolactone decarboxylase family protein [Pseudomonadota bacterium]